MSNIRRLNIGGTSYKITQLKRNHKYILSRNHMKADEWLFISETDAYLRVVKADSLETGKPIVKIVDKYRKERT